MYHSISDSTDRRHPYFQTTTSPARFAQQMRLLHDNGYIPVGLAKAWKILTGTTTVAGKPVVITFDDGYRDFHSLAFPILASYGFVATMFLPTGYISDRHRSIDGRERLTWGEINELAAAGVEFGSHTVTHPQLRELTFPEIEQELVRSKETIEGRIGREVTSFSYPLAFPETTRYFVDKLRETLFRCKYHQGVSTIIGTATRLDDHFFLRRLPVNSFDDPAFFSAKLEGGYDWLHRLQRLKKSLDGNARSYIPAS